MRSDLQFMRTTTEFSKGFEVSSDKRLLNKVKNQRANSLLETQQNFSRRPSNRLDKLQQLQ